MVRDGQRVEHIDAAGPDGDAALLHQAGALQFGGEGRSGIAGFAGRQVARQVGRLAEQRLAFHVGDRLEASPRDAGGQRGLR